MILNESLLTIDSNLTSIIEFEHNETYRMTHTHPPLNINSTPRSEDEDVLYPIEWVIPITVVYGIIFIFGLVGNVSTCIVIARNKSLHTVTNYYLFSIAISDLLLLISGLPPEMYRIWSPATYVFGEAFCVLQGFAAETSANATVLTITAFTVERYLAICHPFLSHTMSNLSRAIKYILAIWVIALCLAAPQAIQFGVEYERKNGVELSRCTVVANDFFQHAFEISTFMIFVGPMTLITVLYILIAIKLNKSKMLRNSKQQRASLASNATCSAMAIGGGEVVVSRASKKMQAQNRVIKMLVAVVVAFFICWAPFHAQRLLAVYLSAASPEAQKMCIEIYIALMYISGVLYFLSTMVNPILYHIMSNKFRQAFKNTFYGLCNRGTPEKRQRTYSVLSRCPPSMRNYQRSVSDGVQNCAGEEQLYMMDLQNANNPHGTKRSSLKHNGHTGHTVHHQHTNGHGHNHAETNINSSTNKPLLQQNKTTSTEGYRTRVHSQSSNTTIVTTISNNLPSDKSYQPHLKTLKETDNNKYFVKFFKIFNHNDENKPDRKCKQKIKTKRKQRKEKDSGIDNDEEANGKMLVNDDISNSSLQDCEEMEYSSTDLMKYMEEVNVDLTVNSNSANT